MNIMFDEQTKKNISSWLEGPYDAKTKEEIQELLKKDPEKLKDAFFQNLSFGTGGARAIMGTGTNRLNVYTIRAMTQGLANYLKKEVKKPTVLIGFDNRNNSNLFAEETAKVLAANEIKVFLFKNLRPVPLVSFGCRLKKCSAAVMITASHNPPKYNGFKVYWSDGGQILPPHDSGIINEVSKITSPNQIKETSLTNPLIEIIDEEMDKAYLQELSTLKSTGSVSDLKIVYTNVHGTGITLLPKAFLDWGFKNVSLVEEQKKCDGNFPFAANPNPESKETLELGINLLIKTESDILIATDPDADRVVVVANHNNKPFIFSGNQLAALLLNHIINKGNLPKNSLCIKTIVTTELLKAICDSAGIMCIDVLTGFKYIAEKINLFEKNYIFGAEESCGYLAETFVRDKDAISAACLIAEYANILKLKKKTLVDELFALYKKEGLFREKLVSLDFKEGQEGQKQIETLMLRLRDSTPKEIIGQKVILIEDYQKREVLNLNTKKTSPIDLPKSNVLRLFLQDNTKIVIRPSGTEPKVKLYIGVVEKKIIRIEDAIELCDKKLETIAKFICDLL